MQHIDELIKTRPYERFGTEPGRSFFIWSNERESDTGVIIPDGLETFRDILGKPIEIFSISTPIEFQMVEELLWDLGRYPQAVFLLEHELEVPNAVLVEMAAAKKYYVVNKRIPREKLLEISAERDEFEKQLHRVGEKVRDNAGKAAETLLAWISEALFSLEEIQRDSERDREIKRMKGEVKFFWERFSRGFPLTAMNIGKWLSSLTNQRMSLEFVTGETNGLVYFASNRDHIIRGCLPLNDRRIALESLLYYAVNDLEIEDTQENSKVRRKDHREKAVHLRKPMLRAYYRLLDVEPDIKQSEAQSRILVDFGNPIGLRQFQRYISKYPRPD